MFCQISEISVDSEGSAPDPRFRGICLLTPPGAVPLGLPPSRLPTSWGIPSPDHRPDLWLHATDHTSSLCFVCNFCVNFFVIDVTHLHRALISNSYLARVMLVATRRSLVIVVLYCRRIVITSCMWYVISWFTVTRVVWVHVVGNQKMTSNVLSKHCCEVVRLHEMRCLFYSHSRYRCHSSRMSPRIICEEIVFILSCWVI